MEAKKIEIVFAKEGEMKFISHLDLLRLFGRACRRSGLPVLLSGGYSPKLKVKIKRALKLGVESRHEEAEFLTDGSIDSEEFKEKLQMQLPGGINIYRTATFEKVKNI